MSLSSLAILDWHLCNYLWLFDKRHFPPKVYGQEQFYLPHQQQGYILRPHESICWKFLLSNWSSTDEHEHKTYMLFGYLMLNKQSFLVCLRPAGRTERIAVILFFAKAFSWIHSNFSLAHYSAFAVEIRSHNSRKLSRLVKDFMKRLCQVILIQDLLCFLNWNLCVEEVLKWTFNL